MGSVYEIQSQYQYRALEMLSNMVLLHFLVLRLSILRFLASPGGSAHRNATTFHRGDGLRGLVSLEFCPAVCPGPEQSASSSRAPEHHRYHGHLPLLRVPAS